MTGPSIPTNTHNTMLPFSRIEITQPAESDDEPLVYSGRIELTPGWVIVHDPECGDLGWIGNFLVLPAHSVVRIDSVEQAHA